MGKKIRRIPVESTMVSAIGYDKKQEILYVEFINTGHVYAYEGVSKEDFEDLAHADSIGRHMRACIIDCYSTFRVRPGRDFKW